MTKFPTSADGRRLTVERKGYSLNPWRIIDNSTGLEIPGPIEVLDLASGPQAWRRPGFATKAAAVEWLGVLAGALVSECLSADDGESSPPGPRQPNGNRVVTGQGSGGKS